MGGSRYKRPAPLVSAGAILLQDGDNAEAVTAAEAGIARLPEERKNNERILMILGEAQIRSGMKEEGRDTLMAVMKDYEGSNDDEQRRLRAGRCG